MRPAAIIMFFIVFSVNYSILDYIGIRPMGFDYFVTVILFLILIMKNSLVLFVNKKWFLRIFYIITAYSILLFLFKGYDFKRFIVGYFITFQFAVFYIVFYSTLEYKDSDILRLIKGLVYAILFLSFVGYIEGVFIDGSFLDTLSLREVSGVFRDRAYFATTLNCGLVLSLTCSLISKNKRYLYISIYFTLTILLTVFRKSIVSALVVWGLYYILFFKGANRFKFLYIAFIIGFPLAVLFGANAYDYFLTGYRNYVLDGDAARNLLYLTSFDLAYVNFPFGSGLGTFASVPTKLWYSDIYYEYGLNRVYGLTPEITYTGSQVGSYVLDAYWSHIIGELGFMGTIFFSFLWFYPAWVANKFKSYSKIHKIYFFFILSITLAMTIEGIGISYPEQSQYILIYSGVSALMIRRANNE